jgi:hypothetical protein
VELVVVNVVVAGATVTVAGAEELAAAGTLLEQDAVALGSPLEQGVTSVVALLERAALSSSTTARLRALARPVAIALWYALTALLTAFDGVVKGAGAAANTSVAISTAIASVKRHAVRGIVSNGTSVLTQRHTIRLTNENVRLVCMHVHSARILSQHWYTPMGDSCMSTPPPWKPSVWAHDQREENERNEKWCTLYGVRCVCFVLNCCGGRELLEEF